MHEQALIWRKNKKEKKRKKTLQPVKKGPIKAEKLQTWKWLAGDSDRKKYVWVTPYFWAAYSPSTELYASPHLAAVTSPAPVVHSQIFNTASRRSSNSQLSNVFIMQSFADELSLCFGECYHTTLHHSSLSIKLVSYLNKSVRRRISG